MKKIFLSILVASAAFFGCGCAKAQIAVNFTAEEMNPKYAEDPEWSYKVNKYIEKIRNN